MDHVRVQPTPAVSTRDTRVFVITADLADPAYQAYLLLRNAFTIELILAGADKFLNAMIDWVQDLAPVIPRMGRGLARPDRPELSDDRNAFRRRAARLRANARCASARTSRERRTPLASGAR
jgi:hypothetical protein